MFAIQWVYALITVICVIAITVYISLANSAVFPGTAFIVLIFSFVTFDYVLISSGRLHRSILLLQVSDCI